MKPPSPVQRISPATISPPQMSQFFFSNIFGIESPSNCVFLAIIAILLVREFFTTVELSQLRNKVAALAQTEALAELDAIEGADAEAGEAASKPSAANAGAGED